MTNQQVNWPYVINLGNSIIGVSILAMPFCFKECGVVLGMLLLFGSAGLTLASCKLLIKAATTARRRTYEFLALHTFGAPGKLAVEVSIIGLLIGTCIAFHVIIGDLGPAIVSKFLGVENTDNLRTSLMILMASTIALPLGLMRSLDSISNISAISIGFYFVFIAEVITLAFPNLWSGVWVAKVVYWNPEGVFKCLPIFSLAFACQTQLFVMYEALAEPSQQRMNKITKSAIGLCMSSYLCAAVHDLRVTVRSEHDTHEQNNKRCLVPEHGNAFVPPSTTRGVLTGFWRLHLFRPVIGVLPALQTGDLCVVLPVGYFGYVAFCDEEISGDILLNFRPTIFSEAIKFGFVLSVAVSFPLVIFPCRTAIYMLLFAHEQGMHENLGGGTYIPPLHFKLITASIVLVTLIIGICVPNVEFILAMTGATMGSMISFIFPAVMFISIMSMSKTNSKSTAQIVLFLGVTILLASTYVTLNTQDKVVAQPNSVVKIADDNLPIQPKAIDPALATPTPAPVIKELEKQGDDTGGKEQAKENKADKPRDDKVEKKDIDQEKPETGERDEDKRQEPPIPHAPDDDEAVENIEEKVVEKEDVITKNKEKREADEPVRSKEKSVGKDSIKPPSSQEVKKNSGETNDTKRKIKEESKVDAKQSKELKDTKAEGNVTKNEKPGENEVLEKEGDKDTHGQVKMLINELEEQRKQNKDILQAQQQLLEEMKNHKNEAHSEKETVKPELNQPAVGQDIQQQPAQNQQQQLPLVQGQQNPQGNLPVQLDQQVQGQQIQQNVPIQGQQQIQQGQAQQGQDMLQFGQMQGQQQLQQGQQSDQIQQQLQQEQHVQQQPQIQQQGQHVQQQPQIQQQGQQIQEQPHIQQQGQQIQQQGQQIQQQLQIQQQGQQGQQQPLIQQQGQQIQQQPQIQQQGQQIQQQPQIQQQGQQIQQQPQIQQQGQQIQQQGQQVQLQGQQVQQQPQLEQQPQVEQQVQQLGQGQPIQANQQVLQGQGQQQIPQMQGQPQMQQGQLPLDQLQQGQALVNMNLPVQQQQQQQQQFVGQQQIAQAQQPQQQFQGNPQGGIVFDQGQNAGAIQGQNMGFDQNAAVQNQVPNQAQNIQQQGQPAQQNFAQQGGPPQFLQAIDNVLDGVPDTANNFQQGPHIARDNNPAGVAANIDSQAGNVNLQQQPLAAHVNNPVKDIPAVGG